MTERSRPLTQGEIDALLNAPSTPGAPVRPPAEQGMTSKEFERLWGSATLYRPAPAAIEPPRPGYFPDYTEASTERTTPTDATLQTGDPNPSEERVAERRRKLPKRTIGVLAIVVVTGGAAVGVNKFADKSIIAVAQEATGFAPRANNITFADFDCEAPAVTTNVKSTGTYVLNYEKIITNADELAKSKKDKSYKPDTWNSFDNIDAAIDAQNDAKQAAVTPFVTGGPAERLPQAYLGGAMNLGVCNTDSMARVVHIDGTRVEIDGSLLRLHYDQKSNKDLLIAYEKFAPKAPNDNPGYISDKEFDRIRGIIVPNEKDPTVNNPEMDALITATTLRGIGESACKAAIDIAAKEYVEKVLQEQYDEAVKASKANGNSTTLSSLTDAKLSFDWTAGAMATPYDFYADNHSIQPDVQILSPVTTCENVTVNTSEGDKK